MSNKHYVGRDLVSFANNGTYKPVSRVTLMIDDDNCVTAGDDTGIELTATCYHATQAMADALLAQFKGYEYPAFEAVAANLDPAAELGDGITADGCYSVISRLSDDGSGYPSPSAPGEAELEDEYPSAGPMTQEFNRKTAVTRALISKTAEEIRLEVADSLGDLSASINLELDKITAEVFTTDGRSRLDMTAAEIRSEVSGHIDGEQAQTLIDQSLEKIELSVSNGTTSSSITLKAGETVIDSANISFTGFVTYTGLSGGTTTINGACIQTGTIDADRLDLSGVATISDLSGGKTVINGACIQTGTIDADRIDTDNLYVDAAHINGMLSADQIKLGGNMTMYQSLDSYVSAGTIGYTRITSVDSSSSWYQAYALGIISDYHAVLAAPSGNLLVMCAGDMYIGSQLNGLIEMTCSDLRINGKAVMDRLTRYEAAFNALGVEFTWSNDG